MTETCSRCGKRLRPPPSGVAGRSLFGPLTMPGFRGWCRCSADDRALRDRADRLQQELDELRSPVVDDDG